MADRAHVSDVNAIRQFRAALVKFAESSNVGLTDGEGEIIRKMSWLSHAQDAYWVQQGRKWTEAVARATDAVRQKRIFKDATGRPQSTVDEEKHLRRCKQQLEEVEAKLANTRKYARQLQRDHLLYRGGVQRLMTMLASDVPNAIALLDRVVEQIEAYAAVAPGTVTSDAGALASGTPDSAGDENMRRAADVEAPEAGAVAPEDDAKPADESAEPQPNTQEH